MSSDTEHILLAVVLYAKAKRAFDVVRLDDTSESKSCYRALVLAEQELLSVADNYADRLEQ